MNSLIKLFNEYLEFLQITESETDMSFIFFGDCSQYSDSYSDSDYGD